MTSLVSMALMDRARAALFGLFIGDALAMPVHWYYDRSRIARDHGGGIVTGGTDIYHPSW